MFRDSIIVKTVSSFFQNSISSTRALIFSGRVDEKTRLQEENKKLTEKLSDFEIIKKENEALRSQFEENADKNYQLLPAKIIGYKGRGAYESFLIDAGENQKVKRGMAVVAGNTLLGTINKTSENISQVITILNPETSLIVKYPPTNARGILRGFNSFMILENVLITDRLEKGGVIVTMGEIDSLDIKVPSNLNVGKISSIDKEETSSLQSARVEPLVDFSQIANVFVILGL